MCICLAGIDNCNYIQFERKSQHHNCDYSHTQDCNYIQFERNFLEITNVFVIFVTQIRANVLQLLSGIYK